MASSNWMFTFSTILILFIEIFCAQFAFGEVKVNYEISNANRLRLSSESNLAVTFSKASPNARFKRQTAGSVDTGAVDASLNNGSQAQENRTSDDMTNAPATTSSRPPTTTTISTPPPVSTQDPFKDSDFIHDLHDYYKSSILKDKVEDYWVELVNTPEHETLSHGHRLAQVMPLKFKFNFYGHPVENVTVATGGFIYMSPFLHKWLTATQYIAPLMANFDPSLADSSSIYYKSYDNMFIVEWRNLKLQDQNNTGGFSFQAILNNDSSIIFAYKKIPVPVTTISDKYHPVKIGMSDAYYVDSTIPELNLKKRTIYEYHRVEVPVNTIKEGTVVILSSLPTCNQLRKCDACIKHTDVKFDCKWCGKIGRCSDGFDWYRQHWDKNGCKDTYTKNKSACTSAAAQPDPYSGTMKQRNAVKDNCADGNCKSSSFPTAAVVVIVLAIVAILAAGGGWVYYAYSHPTSASGMWLMEHRPSQMKAKIQFWKNSSDSSAKYKAETTA